MLNWKNLVRERLKPLHLTATKESTLTEELAQHLEDYYRELRSGGESEAESYREALSELDDMYALQAGLERSERMPKYDAVPAGDVRRENLMEDLWRDLRYASRTMRKSPMFVLFVVLTLVLGIGANTTVFSLINTLILNPLPVRNSGELASVATGETWSTSKSSPPKPISYAGLKDYQAKNEVFKSFAGYTSPRVVTLQASEASQRMFLRAGDRQLLLNVGSRTRQRALLLAGRGPHSRRTRRCRNELRSLANAFRGCGGYCRQNSASQ